MPKLYIIAGPNGSGKTTFAKEFLPHYVHCPNFINADLIASGLSPFSPELARIKAGRLLLKQIEEHLEKKVDFAFESTLAGRSYASLITRMRQKGYSVSIFYLWLPDVLLARERIRQRVKEGGHDISDVDIKRRFERSRINFQEIYRNLCDSWIIFDNAGPKPIEIARLSNGEIKILIQKSFRKFKETEDDKSKR